LLGREGEGREGGLLKGGKASVYLFLVMYLGK